MIVFPDLKPIKSEKKETKEVIKNESKKKEKIEEVKEEVVSTESEVEIN